MQIRSILFGSILDVLLLPVIALGQGMDAHVQLNIHEATLRASLDSLMKWYPVSIVYRDRDVEGIIVSASCPRCQFEDALNAVLEGTSLTWIRVANQVILKVRDTDRSRRSATVWGVVTDSLTGASIAGANVLVDDDPRQGWMRGCPTNAFGFYSLQNLPPGNHVIVARGVGYRTVEIPVALFDMGLQLNINLRQEEIEMPEVTVEGKRATFASAEGFSRGIFIRAASSDQNQYFLDGARIYNPAHYGGVLTTFNDEALEDVEEVVGGMPPSYGGRIGGILDLSMREGTRERLSGSAGVGSLGSSVSLEGPLGDRATFLVSGRRGFPNPMVPFLRSFGTVSQLGSSELIAKLSDRLSESSRLFLTAYVARDSYSSAVLGTSEHLSNRLDWGNTAVNLRWITIASGSTFLNLSAGFTRYAFTLGDLLSIDLPISSLTNVSSDFAIRDLSIRAEAEHYYDEDHTLRAGGELVHRNITSMISEFATQTAPLSLPDFSSWELSIYLQDQWKLLPRVTAELGARATNVTGVSGSFSGVDPRLSVLYSINEEGRLYASLTSVNQFIHPYRNSGVFLFYPTVFWYPSSDQIRPSTSIQVSVGGEGGELGKGYALSISSFYRVANNLHEFGLDTSALASRGLGDVIVYGTGRTYGISSAITRRTGNITGSVRYTLSWGTETFADLNNGEPFTPRLLRRHEVQLDVAYSPTDDWCLKALCVIASDQSPSFAPKVITYSMHPGLDVSTAYDVNGSQLPGFQRLELGVSRNFRLDGMPCQLSLRLLNGYGLLDPISWELQPNADLRMRWKATLHPIRIWPLFPTLGCSVRF